MGYIELQVTSNFSFLRGASHPQELVAQAKALGYPAIAITDRNTLAGIVRAYAETIKKVRGEDGEEIESAGPRIRLIVGCRLDLQDGPSLLAYPTNLAAYSRLCRLLSTGNLRADKGDCHLYKKDVYEYAEGMKFIAIPPPTLTEDFSFEEDFRRSLREYKQHLGTHLYLAATRYYQGDDNKYLYALSRLQVPLVVTNDVHYHHPERRELQDVVTCVREKCTIYNAGYRLHPNAERYLKPIPEMQRLFRHYQDALERTQEIADACQFCLSQLKYEYPEEITTEGRTPQEELEYQSWEGAHRHFGKEIPEKVTKAILHELKFIDEMNYASYFLTVYDIVKFAREQGILCQGRGSAANSTICFCLGITSVDPTQIDLLFERFISSARNEPPDIDVDFEHERREEVIQYIYRKYGRDRAAIVATVTQQHQKGALRDVAKAMGLTVDTINRLSSSIWEYAATRFEEKQLTEQGLDPGDIHLMKVLDLTSQFIGFPRQLGQHTGGFVITRGKLVDLCPVLNARMEDRTCIEWNKDDIDVLGFMKIDVLALGMLTCIRKAFDLGKQHHRKTWTLAGFKNNDDEVYEMITRADTIGVFQIESRAQQSMLPRLRPKVFYDLVIEVAIVRPGPIQGDMVHPYLRRRNKEEKVEYPSDELREILNKTLGVPLFQEQAMKIAIQAAKFKPYEADELRRSMATFKAKGVVAKLRDKLIDGMTANGYTQAFAERIFKQLEGFGSYGFPESHAASFALLVYISSWIKCHYPDVFACSLLNSMPMGFYQPAQIITDARRHGVEVREADINYSGWDNTLEPMHGRYFALRLGLRQIKGMKQEDADYLVAHRGEGYANVNALRDAGIPDAVLERLADADAFRSIGHDRRQALWEVSVREGRPNGMFTGQQQVEQQISLPAMRLSEHVVQDYATASLSLKAHPVSFVREKLAQLHITPARDLALKKDGIPIKVAGLILVRQRPGTASGICFITLEDETGTANLVVFENLFAKYRKEIIQSKLLMVEGKLQREGEVIHVVVQRCYNISRLLKQLTDTPVDEPPLLTLSRADEKDGPDIVWPQARNFR